MVVEKWCWRCFVVVVDVVAVDFVEIEEKKKMVGARGNFELVEKRTCLMSRDLNCLPAIPQFSLRSSTYLYQTIRLLDLSLSKSI